MSDSGANKTPRSDADRRTAAGANEGFRARSRERPRRRWSWLAAVPFIAFLAAWAVLESRFAAEPLRRLVENRAAELLGGGRVEIGKLDFDLLPLRIELTDLRVWWTLSIDGAPRGDTGAVVPGQSETTPTLRADRLAARIAASSLLRQRIEFLAIELDRPHIHLDSDDGRTARATDPDDLGDLVSVLDSEVGPPDASPGFEVVVQQVVVTDGTVEINHRPARLQGELGGIELRIASLEAASGAAGASRASGPAAGAKRGSLSVARGSLLLGDPDTPTAKLVSVRFETEIVRRDRSGGFDVESMLLEIGSSRLEGSGSAADVANGELAVRGEIDLAELFRHWSPPWPGSHSG